MFSCVSRMAENGSIAQHVGNVWNHVRECVQCKLIQGYYTSNLTTYINLCIFFKFLPSKPGDTASLVAAVPCWTTHAGKLKERRAASTVAAWHTNAKCAFSKTHTGSAGEFRERSLWWVKSFQILYMHDLTCVFCPSRHRSGAKSGGKNVSRHPPFKPKAKRKSGAARRAKKMAALSVWPQRSCSILCNLKQRGSLYLIS